jgi:hypothetical protein
MFLLLAKEIKHRVIDPMGDEPEEHQVRQFDPSSSNCHRTHTHTE